jgi:hypothetical protein
MIQLDHLQKSFNDKRVLRGVNLEVPAGSVLGLLGKNGTVGLKWNWADNRYYVPRFDSTSVTFPIKAQ